MTAAAHVDYGDQTVAIENEILRIIAGSKLHETNLDNSDTDEMAIFVEPKRFVYGIDRPADHYTGRTQPEGKRSGVGDVDSVSYSLRRYFELAIKGNPTALLPMFAPAEYRINETMVGRQLRANRYLFLSNSAIRQFLGFMNNQHERMLGSGKRNRVPVRPELVEKFGWDVKYGSHAYRLAQQGLDLARDGELYLPMEPNSRQNVIDIKTGKWTIEQVSDKIIDIREQIEELLEQDRTAVPAKPDREELGELSIALHEVHWRTTGQ